MSVLIVIFSFRQTFLASYTTTSEGPCFQLPKFVSSLDFYFILPLLFAICSAPFNYYTVCGLTPFSRRRVESFRVSSNICLVPVFKYHAANVRGSLVSPILVIQPMVCIFLITLWSTVAPGYWRQCPPTRQLFQRLKVPCLGIQLLSRVRNDPRAPRHSPGLRPERRRDARRPLRPAPGRRDQHRRQAGEPGLRRVDGRLGIDGIGRRSCRPLRAVFDSKESGRRRQGTVPPLFRGSMTSESVFTILYRGTKGYKDYSR